MSLGQIRGDKVKQREPNRVHGLPMFRRLVKSIYGAILRHVIDRRTSIPHTSGDPGSILLVRTDAIGDFVLFTPALRYFRTSFANHRITLVVDSNLMDLASACPFVDAVIPVDVRHYRRNLFYRLSFIHDLRRRAFNSVIHPTYSRTAESDEIVCCSGAARKVGIDGDLNNLSARQKKRNDAYYTTLLKTGDEKQPEIERNRDFTAQVTGTQIDSIDFQPELWLMESDRQAAQKLLKDAGLDPMRDLIAAILPGASWKGKEWPANNYAKVADRIVNGYRGKIVILGSSADANVASSVASGMRSPCSNLAGKTGLRELAAILELCGIYIGNDTGPLHLAVALGIPTLCLMGGGHFGRFYPYGDLNRHRMVYQKMDCYHCNWKCVHETVRCIQELTVDDVWGETRRMMEEVVLSDRGRRAVCVHEEAVDRG
jgi:ADP-heptose:LPS heptosyltransferase